MSNPSGIRAGRAYIEISLSDSQLAKGLAMAQAKLSSWGSAIQGIGTRLAAVGGAALAGVGVALTAFSRTGSELADMSARTGASVESLSEMGYAAQQGGDSLEGLESALTRMNRTLSDDNASDALRGVGLALADLEGLSPDMQLQRIGEQLNGIEDPARRAGAAMDIFGRSGTRILGWVGSLAEARRQARELGLTISTEMAAKADRLGDSFDTLKAIVNRSLTGIGAAISPMVAGAVEGFGKMIARVNAFIDANPKVAQTVTVAAAAIAGLGLGLIATGAALRVFASAMSGPMMLLRALGSVAGTAMSGVGMIGKVLLASMTNPILLTIGALGALGVAWVSNSSTARSALSGLGGFATDTFTAMGTTFRNVAGIISATWEGVAAAITSGDFAGAWRLTLAGAQAGWTEFTLFLTERWAAFGKWFSASFGATVNDLWASMQRGAVQTVAAIRTAFATLTNLWPNFSSSVVNGAAPGSFMDGVLGGGSTPGTSSAWSATGGVGGLAQSIIDWFSGTSPDVARANQAQAIGAAQAESGAANNAMESRLSEIGNWLGNQISRINAARDQANQRDASGAPVTEATRARDDALWRLEAELDAQSRRNATLNEARRNRGNEALERGTSARGTFSATAAAQIGGASNIPAQQLAAAQRQNEQLAEIVRQQTALVDAFRRVDGVVFT